MLVILICWASIKFIFNIKDFVASAPLLVSLLAKKVTNNTITTHNTNTLHVEPGEAGR
jgi:hypothetical protein